MKLSKTRDLLQAWRDAGANPGRGAEIFKARLGSPGAGPTTPTSAGKPSTKSNVASELQAKLERLRQLNPDAAAQIDDLLASGMIRKSDE